MERFKQPIALLLILRQENKIYLQLRKNSSFSNQYCFIAGHLEKDEGLKEGMIREAKEEVGININPDDLELRLILYDKRGNGYMQVYFECHHWQGSVHNCEPDRCHEIILTDWSNIPKNVPDFIKEAINAINKKITLVEMV
jgi:8-oxo-dGTP pyrophosphatase MutT (NUDIX family)